MKKLMLLGMMMTGWSAAAAAQDRGGGDQCPASALPVISQTDVATVDRNSDANSATIQLNVAASLGGNASLTYAFSSADGTLTSDGPQATWRVSGAGPFEADVAVSSPDGCTSSAHFTYHMEATAPDASQ